MASLDLEHRDGVGILTLNRPPMNALDAELCGELTTLLEELATEADLRALVLTGAGKAFSAGVDLQIIPDLDQPEQDVLLDALNRMFAALYGLPVPVVAAVNGHAIAGGIVLALCADHRVAGPGGRHGLTEVAVGVQFPAVTREVVQAELTPGAVRRLVFSAELFGAEEGRRLGVYDEIAEDELGRALEVAEAYAQHNRSVYGAIKAAVRGDAHARMLRAIEDEPLKGQWLSEELREIARARLARA